MKGPKRPGHARVRIAFPSIQRAPMTIRTFDPPRRSWINGSSPVATLDDLVTVTLPVVAGWWPEHDSK